MLHTNNDDRQYISFDCNGSSASLSRIKTWFFLLIYNNQRFKSLLERLFPIHQQCLSKSVIFFIFCSKYFVSSIRATCVEKINTHTHTYIIGSLGFKALGK